MRALSFKRNLEILLLTSIVIFCCVLLTRQFLRTKIDMKDNLQIAKETENLQIAKETENLQIAENNIVVDLNYTTETPLRHKLKAILKCHDKSLRMETVQYGEYWLLRNYIRGRLSINMECAESITYTTDGDYSFIANLPIVVARWLGPISFAIFTPGYDYNTTMNSIQYARNCLPESQLIRDYVTFHLYFPNDHIPSNIALNEKEALKWPYDCQLLEAPYKNVKRSEMYKVQTNLTYPINVGRNIARKAANTYFIFASDIELYPSLGLVEQFLNMVFKNPSLILEGDKPKVFPLTIYKIAENGTIPETKKHLIKMLNEKMAVTFNYFVCKYCHLVPKQKEWLESNSTNELEVFTVVQRYGRFALWEPFYISDNREPLFDERVTWEGQPNKRIQNYAMCLMDYEYHILHPAFLVYAPGIKIYDRKLPETRLRIKYSAAMTEVIIDKIIPEYMVLYGNNTKCKI